MTRNEMQRRFDEMRKTVDAPPAPADREDPGMASEVVDSMPCPSEGYRPCRSSSPPAPRGAGKVQVGIGFEPPIPGRTRGRGTMRD